MRQNTNQPTSPEPQQQRTSSSHVTAAPRATTDHNFDPQIRAQYANEPKVTHAVRQPDTISSVVSDEDRRRHDDSVANFRHLNLSEGEFVILDVKRHPIGLFAPVFATGIALVAVLAGLIMYPADTATTGSLASLPSYDMVVLPMLLVAALIVLGGSIAIWVYLQNHFYMTNESVIQEIQHSLFSRHEQTVSLGSIEDASFRQTGILQTMLDYGTVRLSTEGEETTYRFAYVKNPRRHVAILNNAIEAFKNGRAVEPYES